MHKTGVTAPARFGSGLRKHPPLSTQKRDAGGRNRPRECAVARTVEAPERKATAFRRMEHVCLKNEREAAPEVSFRGDADRPGACPSVAGEGALAGEKSRDSCPAAGWSMPQRSGNQTHRRRGGPPLTDDGPGKHSARCAPWGFSSATSRGARASCRSGAPNARTCRNACALLRGRSERLDDRRFNGSIFALPALRPAGSRPDASRRRSRHARLS